MSRGLSPVVGTTILLAVAVGLASVVGLGVLDVAASEPGPRAHLSLDADAGTDRIALTHTGGDDLPVGPLRIEIAVDGELLAEQPPVPFFAADGFRSGPTGPFNTATAGAWSAGETAAVRLAATNDPLIDPGDVVTVDVYHGDTVVAELRGRAG